MDRRSFIRLLTIAAATTACAPAPGATSGPSQAPTQAPPAATQAAPASPPPPKPSPAAAPTTAAKPAATAPPKTLQKFKVGEIANVFENAYSFVGQEKGFYRDQGVDIEFVDFRDGGTMIKALLAGEIDLCEGGIEPLFPAVAGGANLKIIGTGRPRLNFLLFARRKFNSVPELKGASFATAGVGSFLYNIVVALLKKHGIEASEVEFVNVGSSPDAFKAVDTGKVDAAPGSFDFIPSAEKNPDLHIIANFGQELPLYQRVNLYTTDKVIQDRSPVVLGFLKGLALSIRYGIENKEEIVKVGVSRLGRKAEEMSFGHDQEIKNRILAPNLDFGRENIEFMQQLLVQVGVIQAPLPFERVATLDFQRRVVADIGEYRYK